MEMSPAQPVRKFNDIAPNMAMSIRLICVRLKFNNCVLDKGMPKMARSVMTTGK